MPALRATSSRFGTLHGLAVKHSILSIDFGQSLFRLRADKSYVTLPLPPENAPVDIFALTAFPCR
jgi:hypothetical protein